VVFPFKNMYYLMPTYRVFVNKVSRITIK
jgi:hypothetical protein